MTSKSQWKRLVDMQDLRKGDAVTVDMRANKEECAALAKRLGILEVREANGHVSLTRGARPDLIRVAGEVSAVVVQECCVTLAPVEERIAESYTELLTTSPDSLVPEAETDEDPEKPVELIEGDNIDLSEIVAQWLALALNPYPRSDAPPFAHIEAAIDGENMQTPFQVLQGLKGR